MGWNQLCGCFFCSKSVGAEWDLQSSQNLTGATLASFPTCLWTLWRPRRPRGAIPPSVGFLPPLRLHRHTLWPRLGGPKSTGKSWFLLSKSIQGIWDHPAMVQDNVCRSLRRGGRSLQATGSSRGSAVGVPESRNMLGVRLVLLPWSFIAIGGPISRPKSVNTENTELLKTIENRGWWHLSHNYCNNKSETAWKTLKYRSYQSLNDKN